MPVEPPEVMLARPRHFSMVRDLHLADLFTLANGFAGAAALLLVLRYMAEPDPRVLLLAIALYPLSLAMDFFDGRVARARGKASALGKELDSLCDALSFTVVPAALGYASGLRGPLQTLSLVFFVGCGLARLARFNARAQALAGSDGKVPYFEGIPVTGSAFLVGALAGMVLLGRAG